MTDSAVTDRETAASDSQPKPYARAVGVVRQWGLASFAFTIIAAIFGTVFAVVTPPFWGHDEITQFGRAYQVAHRGLLPHEINDTRGVAYGGDVDATFDDLMGYALRDYVNNGDDPAPRVGDSDGYDSLESQHLNGDMHTIWFTNTAAYSPVPYVPAAIGIQTAELFDLDVGGFLLMTRLAGLLAYVLIVGFALRALRERRAQWLVFTVALLPIAIFQAGTITADTVTNAVAILVGALLLKSLFLADRLTKLESAALLTSVIVLPLCKPTYIFVALLVLLVPLDRLGLSPRFRLVPWGFAAVGTLSFLAWTKISGGTTNGMGLMRKKDQWNSVRPSEQLQGILTDPVNFIAVFWRSILRRDNKWFDGFFGELGFSWVEVPATTIVACLLAIALSVGIAERMSVSFRKALIVTLVVAATVAMIYVTLYLTFSPVGFYIIDGIQGRYFVPLAILFFAALLRWTSLRLSDQSGGLNLRAPVIIIIVATVISLITAVARYNLYVWG